MRWVTVLQLVSWSPENRKGQEMHLSLDQGSPSEVLGGVEAAPASWGWKDTGLVSNKGDVTMALWAGAGDLSALDVQRSRLWLCFMVMLYGCKVLCPTGISQKPWVGRTGVVTVVKRMVMTVEAHCTEPSLVPGSMLKISRGFPTALGSRNLFLMPREAEA